MSNTRSFTITQTGESRSYTVTQDGESRSFELTQDDSPRSFEVNTGVGPAGPTYTLPTASETVKGGVKIGSGITIEDGVISVDSPDVSGLMAKSANLSDVASVSIARTNLGLGTAATTDATAYATASQGSTADGAAQKSANLSDLVSAATARTNLGLGSAATTSSGDYATALQGSNADAHAANTSNPHSVTKSQIGLGSVENTALSTWTGSSNITTLGTIGMGTWQGSSIADAYIASAAAWNAKQSAITFGTGVQTALGVNIGSAGAPVLYNGAGGTPSSITLTNADGTASGLTAGQVTSIGNLTGAITSTNRATSLGSFTFSEINTAVSDEDLARSSGTNTFVGVQSMTSPDITTSLTTPSTSFGLLNTNATNISGFGEATSINLGYNTGNVTHAYSTGATLSGNTKTVNIATTGVSGSTTAVNIGSSVSGATSTVSLFGRFVSNAIGRSGVTTNYFQVSAPADTGITASTEAIGVNFASGTRTWSAGAITTQRERVFGAPTIAFDSASTVTTAVANDFLDPVAGTNATLTNKYAIRTASLNVTGATTLGGAINKVTLTAPATGSTLTIADGKTLTANNSIALTGTDSTTMTFPTTSARIAREDFRTQATAAGTTTLVVGDASIQEFTGSTTQTVLLPTTGVVAGQSFRIINNSTGAVTVQSSGANTVMTLAGVSSSVYTSVRCIALVATPTTAANWKVEPFVAGGASTAMMVGGGATASPIWLTATGTSTPVRNTSPTFATSVIGSASFDVFNTASTTINAFGAATTMSIGGTPTTAVTHNYSTNATAAATTKTINFGTGGAASSTTNINIGSSNGGTTTINSPTIVGASASQTLFNTTATTISAFGAATTMTLGGTDTGTITHDYSGNTTASAQTKNITIGANGASNSTTNVVLGSSTSGSKGGTTINGYFSHSCTARTTGSSSYFVVNTPADTGITASTESIGVNFTASTRTWATGALALQRNIVLAAPTIAFNGASTCTTAVNLDVKTPVAGANATLTNKAAIRAESLIVGTGTTAIQSVLSTTTTWDPGSLANGASEKKSAITLTGVAVGDVVTAALTTIVSADWQVQACVTAADTVEVKITNNTGGTVDLSSGTLRINCMKF